MEWGSWHDLRIGRSRQRRNMRDREHPYGVGLVSGNQSEHTLPDLQVTVNRQNADAFSTSPPPQPRVLIWGKPQVYATSAVLNCVLQHQPAL